MKSPRSSPWLGTIIMAILAMWTLTPAHLNAQAKKGKIDPVLQKLDSNQPAEIAQAISEIGNRKQPSDITALSDRIFNGLPPDLLSQAIDALRANGNKLASKTLIELADHRSPAVREKIAASLSEFKGPATMNALKELLDDQDAKVRSQAAFSIGKLGAKPAMNEMIDAAILGVKEAADAVGEQATAVHVSRLTKMIEDNNLLVLTPVLQAIVNRKNIPKSHKIAIVARLGEISTLSSKALLRLLVKDLPESDPVKKAAAKALEKEEREKKKEEN